METLNFKTNIQTSNDVAAVTQPLNDIEQVDGWNLNTDSPDFLLTVQTTDNRIADQVEEAIRKRVLRLL
ncbi:PH domain-containing protein [Spirosoma rhododendri]|uniref:Copper chaperone n=1 Tax=Spirosoma rhododendri TaxID=2728024 RepID=A0A7L5DVU1_9BACT|nr:copper chaperone [Spirosoma rhododendri]QJD81581.1 copper chaperone [Spirosoma rhododendri]